MRASLSCGCTAVVLPPYGVAAAAACWNIGIRLCGCGATAGLSAIKPERSCGNAVYGPTDFAAGGMPGTIPGSKPERKP